MTTLRTPKQLHTESEIHPFQQYALNRFETLGWPSQKQEAWKYTNLTPLIDKNYQRISTTDASETKASETKASETKASETNASKTNASKTKAIQIDSPLFDSPALTITNGRLCQASVANLNQSETFTISTLKDNSSLQVSSNLKDMSNEFTESMLDALAHSVSLASFGLATDIIHIRVKANTHSQLNVHHVIDSQPSDHSEPLAINTPIVITIEAGAELTLQEVFQGIETEHAYFHNQTTLIHQSPHSQCNHLRALIHSDQGAHIGTTQTHLAQSAQYEGLQLALRGKLLRDSTQVNLEADNAKVTWNALSVGRGEQHTDQQIEVNHLAPNTQSNCLFKSIGQDNAKIHCNGRIHIDEHGHNATGEFYSKNLMLSPHSKVFTKPELEIYHDQVKCAHGATTSHASPDQIRYLTSRGIPEKDALALLTEGFLQEVIQNSWLNQTTSGKHLLAQLSQIAPFIAPPTEN